MLCYKLLLLSCYVRRIVVYTGLLLYRRDADNDRIKMALSVTVLLLMPGNLLVIAVYVRRLTTSIRLYMFGLAVSDTAICFNAIVLGGAFSRGPIPPWLEQAMVYVYDVALFYSVFVLTMISVERYMSVRSPTHFTFRFVFLCVCAFARARVCVCACVRVCASVCVCACVCAVCASVYVCVAVSVRVPVGLLT